MSSGLVGLVKMNRKRQVLQASSYQPDTRDAHSGLLGSRGVVFAWGLFVLLLALGLLGLPLGLLAAGLPEGGRIVAGSGTISQAGRTLTITQTTPRLAADWDSFSIDEGHTVSFLQPSASSVALNRVLGSEVSRIQGSLTATGQVFLTNPNGIIFSPTAQVTVGSLVASTRTLTVEDFLAGRYRFEGTSAAPIRTDGTIRATPGGTVALIAARIEHAGTIEAPRGNVLMGAGNRVRLDLGGPVKLEIDEGALQAQIEQGGAIRAEGGLVYLTAKAAGELASAVINHTGVTEATTLTTGEHGEIWLVADKDKGQLTVGGRLEASGPPGGRGGFIETSAGKVQVAEGATVKAGHWLIDPNDFTIAPSGGDLTGSVLSEALRSGDVTISTVGAQASCTGLSCGPGTPGNGNIIVRDHVSWSSGTTLRLSAHRNIRLLATLDAATGAGGKVALEYGQGSADGILDGKEATYDFGLTGSGFTGKLHLQPGLNFTTKLGSAGATLPWTVITALGNQGDEGNASATNSLQGLAHSSRLTGNYALGADIDASPTASWNGGQGFSPIGKFTRFSGRFEGLGHTIRGLTINRSSSSTVGLFGGTSGATLSNVGLEASSVRGVSQVGALVGTAVSSVVRASYATGRVTGASGQSSAVGGLVGENSSSRIVESFSEATVSGGSSIGGLVGKNWNGSLVKQSYATGTVSGGANVGGLVGTNDSSTVEASFATGSVLGSGSDVGGLIGQNSSGSIKNSYATGAVSGSSISVGGLVGNNDRSTIEHSSASGNVTGQTNEVGGLVGTNTNSSVIEASFATGNVSGQSAVGGLVGKNNLSTVEGSYYRAADQGRIDNVRGTGSSIGGLVGSNFSSTIRTSYASGRVQGDQSNVGGLVGSVGLSSQPSSITDSYATGEVTGTSSVGGLVGEISAGTIENSYAATVVRGGSAVGGLVGRRDSLATVRNSFWDIQVSGQATSAGGTGKPTAEMKQLATFSTANWDIDDTGGTGRTWRIYEGQSYPLLRRFLTPLTVTATSGTRVYDGTRTSPFGVQYSLEPDQNLLGGTPTVTAESKDVGNWTLTVSGLFSTRQDGYDISYQPGTLTITPKPLTVSYQAADKVYDGTPAAAVSATSGDLIAGDAVMIRATGAFADQHVGANKPVSITGGTLDGPDAGNYQLQNPTGLATASITPRPVDLTGSRVYDGTTEARAGIFTLSNLVEGESLTLSGSGSVADKHVGTGKAVSLGTLTLGNGTTGLASNYTLAGGAHTLTITPKPLTVSGITAQDKVYDGTQVATLNLSAATFEGLIPGDDVRATGTFASKHVGTNKPVTLTWGGADAGNYAIAGQTSTMASITPKPLTITGTTVAGKVYDGTTEARVTPGTLSGFVGSETVNVATATGTFDGKDVGSRTVTVRYTLQDGANGGLATNYTLAATTHTASITPRPVDLTGSRVYDGTTEARAGIFTLSNLVEGESLTLSGSGSVADKHVGTGKAVSLGTLTLGNGTTGLASNYTLVGGRHQATITPRPILVMAEAKRKLRGQPDPPLTYATGCPAGVGTVCGLVAGEQLRGSLAREPGETFGRYAILQGTVSEALNPNYRISFQGANLTIEMGGIDFGPHGAAISLAQTRSRIGAGRGQGEEAPPGRASGPPAPQAEKAPTEAAPRPVRWIGPVQVQETGILLPEEVREEEAGR
jgi:filamentous hemagglutinin family protein